MSSGMVSYAHMNKLLCIFAHPDDETFAAGGTIAKYAKSDWTIDLVCATRGEGAVVPDHHSVVFMDYKDGTLASQSPGNIEDKLIELFTAFGPDVAITVDPTGINNNPDSIKLSFAATFAFQIYAKLRHKNNPSDDHPPKLYYACMPESVAEYLKKNKVIPPESFGKPWRGIADKLVSTVIDIKRFAAIKKKASLLTVFANNPLLRQEYFILRMVGINEAFMGKNDHVSDRL